MKKKFIEITADGKREIEEGKEPLNKQPGKGQKPFPIDAAQSNYQDAQNEERRKKEMKKDELEGGRADKSKPSDFDKKQLEMGTKHEMEHTKDRNLAREIAMDHLKEDADYYSDLKEIEKSVSNRWNLIKKALKHEEAFMDIGDDDDDEEEEEDNEQESIEEAPQEEEQGDITDEEHGHLEELLGDAEDRPDQGEETQDSEEGQSGEGEDEIPEDVVEAAGGEEEIEEMSDEDLADLMKQLGHSDTEIAYVLHNHTPPTVDAEAQDKLRREQEMHEIDITGKKQEQQLRGLESGISNGNAHKTGEMEIEHKQKMNDLEYDMARREKEIELKYKEKELELKLKQTQDDAKHSINTAKKDADQKRDHKDQQHKKKLSEPAPKPTAKK